MLYLNSVNDVLSTTTTATLSVNRMATAMTEKAFVVDGINNLIKLYTSNIIQILHKI